jgi:plasmid stabilization system protein ParE
MSRIVQREAAERDPFGHFIFIGQTSERAARKFLKAAQTTFELLASQPRIGHLADLESALLKSVRAFPIKGSRCAFHRTPIRFRRAGACPGPGRPKVRPLREHAIHSERSRNITEKKAFIKLHPRVRQRSGVGLGAAASFLLNRGQAHCSSVVFQPGEARGIATSRLPHCCHEALGARHPVRGCGTDSQPISKPGGRMAKRYDHIRPEVQRRVGGHRHTRDSDRCALKCAPSRNRARITYD